MLGGTKLVRMHICFEHVVPVVFYKCCTLPYINRIYKQGDRILFLFFCLFLRVSPFCYLEN